MFSLRTTTLAAAMVVLAACSDSGSTTQPTPGPTPPPTEPVASVTVEPTTVTLTPGQTRQLAVTTRSATNAVLTGRAVSYESSKPAVAAVSQAGIVTAVSVGDAVITATSEGKSAQANITVERAPVASIEITPGTLALDVGTSATVTAITRDAQNNVLPERAVTWQSSKPQIASVDANGKVTGLAAGTAMLSATSEGKVSHLDVSVRAVVASVEIVGALDTLEAWEIRELTAIARDAQGAIIPNVQFAWTSSNVAIASIDPAYGYLTGLDRGTVTVTATSPNGKSATVTRVVVIKYRSVTLGTQHACDLASGGIAWCWGLNGTDARLGSAQVGDNVFIATPYRVPGEHRYVQLVTYGRFTCGLRADAKAFCWGNNGWGMLGNGTSGGFSSTPVAVAGNNSFLMLTAGIEHVCGLTPARTVLCWGHNDWGQFGIGNTTSSNTPVLAANGMQFATISAGSNFTCGVTLAGAAWCWGANSLGQLGDGGQISYGNVYKTAPNAVAGGRIFASVTTGDQFACGIATNGAAFCWGSNSTKLGTGAGGDASTPQAVTGGHTFLSLDSGFGHSCGITSTDNIYCWGSNGYGQLGTNSAGSSTPLLAAGGLKAAEVNVAGIGTGSGGFTCAISKDRLTTYCWGRNEFGQLGNGTTNAAASVNSTPTIVQGQKPL